MFNPTAHGITPNDFDLILKFTGAPMRQPDFTIAPDGKPYLHRWHLVPRNRDANVYFHVQVADDPERPLHDHPWDNTSVILAGGYVEIMQDEPHYAEPGRLELNADYYTRWRSPGDVIYRGAKQPHRLVLPPGHRYSMSLFMTGPVVRDWGFWFPDGWRSHTEVIETVNGQSEFKK